MDQLESLVRRLNQINKAREMNKKIREAKLKRIQEIDSIIYSIEMSEKLSRRQIVPKNRVWGIKSEEINKIVKLFWSSKNIENNDDSKSSKNCRFSIEERKQLFMNQTGKLWKRGVALNIRENNYSIETCFRARVHPFDNQLSFHDKVRCIIFLKAYGKYTNINDLYPHISQKRFSGFIKTMSNNSGDFSEEEKNYIIELFK